jgi:hypothetical protein
MGLHSLVQPYARAQLASRYLKLEQPIRKPLCEAFDSSGGAVPVLFSRRLG